MDEYGAHIEISNIIPKEDERYYLIIRPDNSKPDITKGLPEDRLLLSYDNEEKLLKNLEITKYVELNQDLYATIVCSNKTGYQIVTYGKKIERYEEPKYSDAFFATLITNKDTQIVTNFTHNSEYNRKMQIKIGKISDISILKKIKNKDTVGFDELLNYAKSNSGIFDKIVDINDCKDMRYEEKILLNNIENDEYYFLYVKTDDEDGKYISNEAVTLAKAINYNDEENSWYMFFYGDDNFSWKEWENGTPNVEGGADKTIAGGNLPKAGVQTIVYISIIALIISVGIFSYIQYRRNNF